MFHEGTPNNLPAHRPTEATLLRIGFQLDNEPGAIPKLNGAAIDKALGLSDCLGIIGTHERLESDKMSVAPDGVGAIFGHPLVPYGGESVLP